MFGVISHHYLALCVFHTITNFPTAFTVPTHYGERMNQLRSNIVNDSIIPRSDEVLFQDVTVVKLLRSNAEVVKTMEVLGYNCSTKLWDPSAEDDTASQIVFECSEIEFAQKQDGEWMVNGVNMIGLIGISCTIIIYALFFSYLVKYRCIRNI